MSSHINISDPERDERNWAHMRQIDALKAELKTAYAERDHYMSNLSAIFTRIERGEHAELHYANGDVIRIGAVVAGGEHDD